VIVSIIAFLVIALVAGFIASYLMGQGKNFTLWEMLAVGAVGSFVGGILINIIVRGDLEVDASGLIGSVVGAIIVLAVWMWWRPRMAAR
jgi:uncharacterized membrane protein YeaQ/YmgE (transglycosylase-associated protein family)